VTSPLAPRNLMISVAAMPFLNQTWAVQNWYKIAGQGPLCLFQNDGSIRAYWPGSATVFPQALCTKFVPPSRERWHFRIFRCFVFCNLQMAHPRGKNDPVSGHHRYTLGAGSKALRLVAGCISLHIPIVGLSCSCRCSRLANPLY